MLNRVGLNHVIATWFENWEFEFKSRLSFCKNGVGTDGIAIEGYMVVLVEDNKLRLLYTGERSPEYLNAADPELFVKLEEAIPKMYFILEGKGWFDLKGEAS